MRVFPDPIAEISYQGLETLTQISAMRTLTSVIVLSLLAIPLSVGSQVITDWRMAQLQDASATQLLAAKTTIRGNPAPPPGSGRKPLFQLQENPLTRL
jgi:hypothetical protein